MSSKICRFNSTAYPRQGFNGVSLFANYTTEKGGTGDEVLFNAAIPIVVGMHTITIYTSAAGSAGSKVSVHKSLLLSALTVKMDKSLSRTDITNGHWSDVSDDSEQNPNGFAYDGTMTMNG